MLTQTMSTKSPYKPETSPLLNYTVSDLAYYYADLQSTPRLTEQERQDLLTRMQAAQSQDERRKAQHQLVESYLYLARYLARELRRRAGTHHSLPDLIGAANVALVEIMTSRDLSHVQGLTSYLATCLRGDIRDAILEENPVKISWNVQAYAKEEGTLDSLLDIASLDEKMQWQESKKGKDLIVIPLTPTSPAPERDPKLRAKAEQYLSSLPPRTQTIIRLRFGLSEDDERAYSILEIAKLLRLSRTTVDQTFRKGMAQLRAIATGKGTIRESEDRTCSSRPNLARASGPEKVAALTAACAELEAAGTAITAHNLVNATGVGMKFTRTFLQVYQKEIPKDTSKEARDKARQERLEEAYQRLSARGNSVGRTILAKEAHVGSYAAGNFLKERKERDQCSSIFVPEDECQCLNARRTSDAQ